MRDDLVVGGLYLSNNPCFPGQVFQVTGVSEVQERFGKPNRIIDYKRWAHRRGSWYLVEITRSWEHNGNRHEFGQAVPLKFHSEIPALAA